MDSITQATKKSDGSRVAVKMVEKVMVILMMMVMMMANRVMMILKRNM